MEVLSDQFSSALKRIEVSGPKADRAKAAHHEVRAVLETDPQLQSWRVDTVLIGSYARHTGIYPGNDVDIFTKLQALDTSSSPSTVYEAVRRVLVAHYGARVTPRDRSLKIEFADDGFSVDVVPAVHSPPHWAIPNKDREQWDVGENQGWVVTDPERLTELTSARNRTPLVGSQGAYVPTVKLVRQSRSHHLGEDRPGGLYVELTTHWAFEGGAGRETFAECLHGAITHIRDHLASGEVLIDPPLGTPYAPALTELERENALRVFDSLAKDAERALTADRCEAAFLWRRVLGANERGPVFPLPEGCDETGRELSGISSVSSRGSDEARGFGVNRFL